MYRPETLYLVSRGDSRYWCLDPIKGDTIVERTIFYETDDEITVESPRKADFTFSADTTNAIIELALFLTHRLGDHDGVGYRVWTNIDSKPFVKGLSWVVVIKKEPTIVELINDDKKETVLSVAYTC